ncbi:MAG: DUF3810 domain-containing protein [Sedimentibacter sp.]
MKNKLMVLTLIPISFILTTYAKFNLSFAEFYAVEIYPVFAGAISFFTSKISGSLAEIIIAALIILLIIYTLSMAINSFKHKTTNFFKNYIANIGVAVSCIYCLFVLFCGLNYYRYEFTHYSGLVIEESSKEELVNLCEILINDANEMRGKLNTSNDNTAALYDYNYYGTSKRAKNSFNSISAKYEILKGNYPAPKPVKLSKIMSHMNITGIYFPFTFEANVNVDIPPYQIPATMLHELVHLRGFMREDEANFISYLACINSGYDDFAYSGTMLALTYSMNALYAEDYDSFAKLYETYSEDVKNDIAFSKNYWKQFDTKVAEISSNINDTYLKANNQEDGVKSYGKMVDLLLAYYRNLA